SMVFVLLLLFSPVFGINANSLSEEELIGLAETGYCDTLFKEGKMSFSFFIEFMYSFGTIYKSGISISEFDNNLLVYCVASALLILYIFVAMIYLIYNITKNVKTMRSVESYASNLYNWMKETGYNPNSQPKNVRETLKSVSTGMVWALFPCLFMLMIFEYGYSLKNTVLSINETAMVPSLMPYVSSSTIMLLVFAVLFIAEFVLWVIENFIMPPKVEKSIYKSFAEESSD
ncbi:MAG: hypothetical protein LUD19_00245, partial [Clostridia bacterium]|nr:hypothetical protein [Clostridia bacterium]